MKQIFELNEINNGYLVNEQNTIYTSFQYHASNDQTKQLLQFIINKLGVSHELTVMDTKEYAKLKNLNLV